MTNNTLNAILNAPFAVKKKVDGKLQPFTVTMLDDNFKHLPKNSDLTNDAVESLQALNRCYIYMEQSLTAKNEHQAEKSWNKATEAAQAYLQAVGINATAPNIGAIMCIFSAKQQTKTNRTTKEKAVVGGYTTATTFKRCALYLTNHYITTGTWCDLKKTGKSSNNTGITAATPEELARYLADNFGMDYDIQLKKLKEGEAKRLAA